MVTSPVAEMTSPCKLSSVPASSGTGWPARVMRRRMDPVAAEPLRDGRSGKLLRLSEALAVADGIGTVLAGHRRGVGAAAGGAAGHVGAHQVRRVRGGHPVREGSALHGRAAKRRLAAHRAADVTEDSTRRPSQLSRTEAVALVAASSPPRTFGSPLTTEGRPRVGKDPLITTTTSLDRHQVRARSARVKAGNSFRLEIQLLNRS